jgi:hypothetical protein
VVKHELTIQPSTLGSPLDDGKQRPINGSTRASPFSLNAQDASAAHGSAGQCPAIWSDFPSPLSQTEKLHCIDHNRQSF